MPCTSDIDIKLKNWRMQGFLNWKIIIKLMRIIRDTFRLSMILKAFRVIPNKKHKIPRQRVEYTLNKCLLRSNSMSSSLLFIFINLLIRDIMHYY